MDRLVHYPDPDCTDLVRSIVAKFRAPKEQIVVGNGSSEIFVALCRALGFRRAVIPIPTYSEYAAAVRMADSGGPAGPDHEIRFVPLAESEGFVLNWRAIEAELDDAPGAARAAAVFLGQPNNPTGLMFDVRELRDLAARRPGTTFVIDEAFADFVAGYRSLVEGLPQNLIVVRSFTKFYAIPGLRLGFAVARPVTAARIRQQIAPWSVNTLAQAAGIALLAEEEYARRTIALVQEQRERLRTELAAISGLFVYPGTANYLLVRIDRPGLTAPALAGRLLDEAIAIRTFDAGQHLDARFFRIAVRTAEENETLAVALAAALRPPRRPKNRQACCRADFPIRHQEANAGDGPGDPSYGDCFSAPRKRKKQTPALMIQGTSSNAGKSVMVAALGRILLQDGIRVAPFKSQNMSLNSFVTRDGGEMGRAQVVQAQACRLEPDVRMNPILIKPNSDTGSQVIVRGKPVGNMRVAEYVRYKPEAFAAARECYDSLAAEFDAIVLEGAGSPGEVNLKDHDIVNMRMAEYAQAPVLIVGDIDRGGVFASFVGTMEVLAPWERRLVAGWIVNRFRGDDSLLAPALGYTLQHTGRPVFGVVPYLAGLDLPQEDSVEFKSGSLDRGPDNAAVEIAVIDLPHISNFTDFDAFRVEADVRLRVVRSAAELGRPDAVMLPGSKNALADLEYLRQSGAADRIASLAVADASEIVGICGGFQMLGRQIRDPLCIESADGEARGLGLLPVSTILDADKTLIRTTAVHASSGLEVVGYEIHHGRTALDEEDSNWVARPERAWPPDGNPGSTTPFQGAPPRTIAVASFTRPDGEVVGVARSDHRVWGTYLHGVFDADRFRRWFIDRLRVRRGLPPLGELSSRYDIEPVLDRLADVVRRSLRMEDIYRLLGSFR